MRHGKKSKKIGRGRDQKRAFLKIMASNLILKEKIKTTEARAKVLKPFVEKLITKGKRYHKESADKLAINRRLTIFLPMEARKKNINELGLRYQNRNGGYTRITKTNPRKTDGARMAIIELVK